MANIALLIVFLLLTKHFIIDFLLQDLFPYMWMNKGTYGHLGGILHACSHMVATILVLCLLDFPNLFVVACLEGAVHYHIDWAKMNINKRFGWQCNTSPRFWDLVGLDQWLHNLCYLAMTWYFTSSILIVK
jgi:hypothetical protein